MTLDSIKAALREIFPRLTPEDQRDLLATIEQLRIEAAERAAQQIKDPMTRAFAQGLAQMDRAALAPSNEPKQITDAKTRKNQS